MKDSIQSNNFSSLQIAQCNNSNTYQLIIPNYLEFKYFQMQLKF